VSFIRDAEHLVEDVAAIPEKVLLLAFMATPIGRATAARFAVRAVGARTAAEMRRIADSEMPSNVRAIALQELRRRGRI
jgi:hypothetical protein